MPAADAAERDFPGEDESDDTASKRRPDWLTGPEDDVLAAEDRPQRAALPPAPAEPATPSGLQPWKAAASSIPRIPSSPPPASLPAVGETRVPRAAARYLESSEPGLPLDDGEEGELPDHHAERQMAEARAKLPHRAEPWWMVALEAVRSERRVQVLVGLAVVLAVALPMSLRGQESPGVSISHIRHDPPAWDGRAVKVRGQVGEVYHVGGGYAFYLLQGRDTLVTFTRSRVPAPRQTVTVEGQISTGFLDGMPRQALFEGSAP